jgi:hypothetical protein
VNCIWKFDRTNQSFLNIGLVSQTTTCPFTLRQALPEPKRASKDAFGKKSIGHFRIQYFSKLMKFIAKAAIPEEATQTVGTYFVCRL